MTVSGSSNRIAETSSRTMPRPSEIFCFRSAVRLAARRSASAPRPSISMIRATRSVIFALATPRFFSGKARFSATVMVS